MCIPFFSEEGVGREAWRLHERAATRWAVYMRSPDAQQ